MLVKKTSYSSCVPSRTGRDELGFVLFYRHVVPTVLLFFNTNLAFYFFHQTYNPARDLMLIKKTSYSSCVPSRTGRDKLGFVLFYRHVVPTVLLFHRRL